MATKLITMNELRETLGGRARMSIYRDIEAGRIPAPRYLGGRPVWLSSEIEELLQNLPREKSAA